MKKSEKTIAKQNARRGRLARLGGEAMRAAHLPETTAGGFPRVTLLADLHAEIENHMGVLELAERVIRLKTAIGILRIEGERLEIRSAERESMLIDGKIVSVCFEIPQ